MVGCQVHCSSLWFLRSTFLFLLKCKILCELSLFAWATLLFLASILSKLKYCSVFVKTVSVSHLCVNCNIQTNNYIFNVSLCFVGSCVFCYLCNSSQFVVYSLCIYVRFEWSRLLYSRLCEFLNFCRAYLVPHQCGQLSKLFLSWALLPLLLYLIYSTIWKPSIFYYFM